jgi:nitrate reductase gamma subunit
MDHNSPIIQPTSTEKTEGFYSSPKIDISSNKLKSNKTNTLSWQTLFLLGTGVTLIYFYNFMANHEPGFFYIYTEPGNTLYYVAENIIGPLGVLLALWSVALFISTFLKSLSSNKQFPQEDLNALRERVIKEPGKTEPIWDLGRANLQQYFNRNLSQISNIFRLSVGVMIVGFLLIAGGIIESFVQSAGTARNVNTITPALIGSLAGVITEFIGATFLFIYRSTVQQASSYMKTLERITIVGMATQILDTITEEARDMRDTTKAEMVKLLLTRYPGQNAEGKEIEPKEERKGKKEKETVEDKQAKNE